MSGIRLSDVISVPGRFHRSVNLPRDWDRGTDLSDYVVTPTIHDLAERILDELRNTPGTRSWSITGPYGSGKSAFALFLADLLAAEEPTHPVARELSEALEFPIEPFVPVLLVAERKPLIGALKTGLADALEEINPHFARRAKKIRNSEISSGEQIAALFGEAANAVRDAGYGGLLLVVDELGKFLEFASSNPEEGDVFVLQQLAEATSRSEAPILFVTILHSGFADYLRAGNELQRAEWQKVQGRFRDVPFQLPAEQVLALVAQAVGADPPQKLARAWKQDVDSVLASGALQETKKRIPVRLLEDCIPLHPLVALLLWPLFRSKVAQNERSLFAFLTSTESSGFQAFLQQKWSAGDPPPFYRVADLYDYVSIALGLSAFTGEHARKWSLMDYAIHRMPGDAPATYRAVVKAIGLLSLYGPSVGLIPSREALELAIGEDLGEALRFLEARSIIVFRKHSGGYALWEGSDVDLDSAFAEAWRHVGSGDVVDLLKSLLNLQPIVARAHYIQSGTFRFMEVDVVPARRERLAKALQRSTKADGLVVYAVPDRDTTVEKFLECAQELTDDCEQPLRVVAIPHPFKGMEEALRELEAWTWVNRNLRELQGDPVARQEVRARTTAARDRFESLTGRVFGLAGSAFEPAESAWVYDGQVYPIDSALEFQRWISARCRETFPSAPHLHNELLNRQDLSSAASAARRNLLERMIEAADIERLGIEGTPAEASMYESMLRAGGFHRRRKGAWSLGKPTGDWQPVWDAAVSFVEEAEGTRRSVTELLDRLRQPPFGIRDGPLPVVLWAVLLAKRDEVALYEDGVFVPELRVEVVERLVRRPETFEIQSQRLDSDQAAALQALRSVIGDREESGRVLSENDFLPVVKGLILFASRLQPFARKTKRLTPPEASKVRDLLLDARDPRALLFEQLPEALNISLSEEGASKEFAGRLRECLVGLGRVYPDLLDDIEQQLRRVFSLNGTAIEARQQLAGRAAPLVEFAVDGRLRLFVHEAAADRADRDWRESLARVLHDGLPPSHWSDRDATVFQVRLTEVASEFTRLEELVAEKQKGGFTQVIRIGILDGRHRELRAVIPLEQTATTEVADLANRVSNVLGTNGGDNGFSELRLAALARVAVGLLDAPAAQMENQEREGERDD